MTSPRRSNDPERGMFYIMLIFVLVCIGAAVAGAYLVLH
jgi:hypothetical protein